MTAQPQGALVGNMAFVCIAELPAVHPGIADSTWYLKSDDKYMFSWVVSKVRSVAPWVGCGQPVKSGAISSIYVSAYLCHARPTTPWPG